MHRKLLPAVWIVALSGCLWAQAPPGPEQAPAPAPAESAPASQSEPAPLLRVEMGGFSNFVNNNYGTWDGFSGRFTYLRGKRFTPSFGFARQRRPNGAQTTLGIDSYIVGTKWFYMIGGIGGSPEGSAELFPKLSYGITGLFSIPHPKGLVATLAASQLHGTAGAYGRVLTVGAMYYRGRTIWNANLSFNRTYPGAVPSKSGGFGVQFGTEKKFWIGGGMGGGRVAYNTVSLTPLDVRSYSFGPNLFLQKWITNKWGVIVKYGYQDYVDFYQSHGVEAKVFFEVP